MKNCKVQRLRGAKAEDRLQTFLHEYFNCRRSTRTEDLGGVDLHCSFVDPEWAHIEADLQVKSTKGLGVSKSGKDVVRFKSPFPGMLSHYRGRVDVIVFVIDDRSEIYALPMRGTLAAEISDSLKGLDKQTIERDFHVWHTEFARRGLVFEFGDFDFISFISEQIQQK